MSLILVYHLGKRFGFATPKKESVCMPIESDAGLVIAEMENRRGRGEEGISMLELAPKMALYRMPPVSVGTQVVWYPRASRTAKPMLGFVSRCETNGQNIDIYVPTELGYALDSVPHITDPRIAAGHEQIANGAWDYTDEYKQKIADRHAVEERLAKLESELVNLSGRQQKTKTTT